MRETYERAINQVFKDEGGYTHDAADPGGPTNWGITIYDARMYWKSDATAEDVRNMPKDVAVEIYKKHYADPIKYNELPAGVDYAVLDYGINSGISRSVKVVQKLVGVDADGRMGPATVQAIKTKNPKELINAIYDERLEFLQRLSTWGVFGRGWSARCSRGRALALDLVKTKSKVEGPMIIGTGIGGGAVGAAMHWIDYWPYILGGTALALLAGYIIYKLVTNKENVNVASDDTLAMPEVSVPTGKAVVPVDQVPPQQA